MKRFAACLLVLLLAAVTAARADASGKIQGKVVATDTGEPLAFASVQLVPADTTQRPLGRLTNADGTFLIEAPAGRYTLRILALSYAKKSVEGIIIEDGKVVPFDTALPPEAIQQEEIVVEAKARENNEVSMLAARKKATSVGDAVSAEQVRKSPDKNAAEVLRRVTGLSVSDGKYVFVRGLGERYSSTEVDGVRIGSPEQNKRVVPLDLFPAALLENIVVQKTYTADRPGEFGGGDVQVHTKDFPGGRTWSFSASQGMVSGVTFKDRRTYPGASGDYFGFGAGGRGLPVEVTRLGGGQKLDEGVFAKSALVGIGKAFSDVWSPRSARTPLNSSYAATYGDEFVVFGHPLGLIQSWTFSRSFDARDETARLFRSASGDTVYDYDVNRSTASVQLGGVGGLSYRLSPRHSLHLRGLYTNSADDEVRVYEGADHTRVDSGTGLPLVHRGTRLQYVQRNVLSGTLEGQHQLPRLHDLDFNWKLTRSSARRQQPDRRETVYDKRSYVDFGTGQLVEYWSIGGQGNREFGDLKDNGWGGTGSASVPFQLGGLGKGKIKAGFDRQTKDRDNLYRRFQIIHNTTDSLLTLPPDSLFAESTFDTTDQSAYVIETTKNDSRFTDNYRATQHVTAGYLSVDVPLGTSARGNLGVRVEDALQDVKSFDPFNRDSTVQEGRLRDTDWLPSMNVTWLPNSWLNVRLAASRTVSRPDLNELSPSPSIDYEGGSMRLGNPKLRRARIDNYDVRFEVYPSLSEVFAVGFFYKRLRQPIELVIQGAADPLVYPQNSDRGRNFGVELEARSRLGRLWKRLDHLTINSNASIISSEVDIIATSQNGSQRHPLQGQASYLVNGALSYAWPHERAEMTVLVSMVGKRLAELGYLPLPDIYEQPFTSLDATLGFTPVPRARFKLSAKNLLDSRVQLLQGGREVSSYHQGRNFSLALSYGM